MKILVASDSFKGTLLSGDIGRIVRQELEPAHQVDYLTVSDGGEGFLDAWGELFPGVLCTAGSVDPLGRKISCTYILSGKTAILESAVTIGLGLLAESERDPMLASSYGLGMLIRDAVNRGAEKVYIGLGGSAVNDGGAGMIRAMGGRLLDADGQDINDSGGRILGRIAAVDPAGFWDKIRDIEIFAVCDVESPLLGPTGATRVYGPQKGAGQAIVEELEAGMASFAGVVQRMTGRDLASLPGAGAAGGLGFALSGFFRARLMKGIDALIEMSGLEEQISRYDLIITGEGKLDQQTHAGKAPLGMLRLGQRHQIPVICLCGQDESNGKSGFHAVYAIVPRWASPEQAMARPEDYLCRMIREAGVAELPGAIGNRLR